jgi:pimeloyl-ACP methyl ester carboxylesterase
MSQTAPDYRLRPASVEGEVRYAKSGHVHLAYRVFGSGPRDIILVPGTVSHVELYWEMPINQVLLRRLSSFARVIVFDKRGQGLSDRDADQTLEERVGDLLAVMKAAGSRRAIVYGWSEGGQMSLTFAAKYPARVSALVLYGAYASIGTPPWSVSRERYEEFLTAIEAHWGEGILVHLNAPGRVEDKAFVQWFARLERAVASPGAILALMRANYEIDVRQTLRSIRVPTLILHRAGDALVPVEAGRHLARNIPRAKYVELPGDDHMLQALDWDVMELLLDQIEKFVTGKVLPRSDAARVPADPLAADQIDSARHLMPVAPGGNGIEGDAIAELQRYREIIASGEDERGLAGLVARAEAVAAASRGSWSESEAQFTKAAETFRRLGMVWQEALTFQSWGQSLQAGQAEVDRRAAIEKLDTAIQLYRQAGASVRRTGSLEAASAGVHNGNGASKALTRRRPDSASCPAMFRREGDFWTLSWQGKVTRIKDAKGLHYIAYLLGNPGREVLARELAASGAATGNHRAALDPGSTIADLGDAGVVLDAKAREQYRRRIGQLREELAEADRLSDTGRTACLRSELEMLGEQLVAAVGLGGRDRKAASHAERARLMVTKAIKAALAKIRDVDAAMGRHLATSIKTGNCCAYDPGPPPTIYWQL